MRDDDKKLWDLVRSEVKPLKKNNTKKHDIEQEIKKLSKKISTKKKYEQKPPVPAVLKKSKDVDRKTFDRFKKGKRQIEAVLDLHGLTQERAHNALIRFIRSCYGFGKRNILVITGKGQRSGGVGVLRRLLPIWLEDTATFGDCILSVLPAQPKDGGTGAFYVLLRRQR